MAGFTQRADLTLADITFPASHDAGLTEAAGGYEAYWGGGTVFRDSVICQYHDIAGQLAVGSRAFDLRIAEKGGALRAFHGEGIGTAGGGWGHTADSMFQQVDAFLAAHPGEIVIIRISHTKEAAGVHRAVLANIDGSRLLKCGPRNLASVPLNQLRGKAVAIFDEKALARTDPYSGLHRLSKYKSGAPGEGLPVCGKYAGQSAGFKDMVKTALKCGNEHGGHPKLSTRHDHLFMVYWQLANSVKTKTTKSQDERIKTLKRVNPDKGTHYNLDYLLNVHRGVGVVYEMEGVGKSETSVTAGNFQHHRPNWINLDFVNEIACNKVIEFNSHLMA